MAKKTRFKKITGWLHLYLGLAAGLVIMVVALTGSLLVFEDELEPVLFKERHIVQPAQQHLPVDSIVSIASNVFPGAKPSRLIIDGEKDQSVEARIGAKGKAMKVAYINPYNGKVLYKGSYKGQFFQQVRDLHRYLLLDKTGKTITGISCAICLFLVISGLILWWPATKKILKQRVRIKWDGSGKRFNWDFHAVGGFYFSLVLLVITSTGLVWSYNWLDDLLFHSTEKTAKNKAPKKEKAKAEHIDGALQLMEDEINKLYPYEGKVGFNLPAKAGANVTVQKEPLFSVVRHIDAATFNGNTGKLMKQLPYDKLPGNTRARRMLLPLHTGSLLGWPTKILALIVSLFTACLPVSGLIIWLGRRNKKPRKTSRRKQTTEQYLKTAGLTA